MPTKKRKPAHTKETNSDIVNRAAIANDRIDLADARARMKERGSVPWVKVKEDLGL